MGVLCDYKIKKEKESIDNEIKKEKESIDNQIKKEKESIDKQIYNYKNEINNLESAINNKRSEIEQKMENSDDYKIKEDIEKIYDLLKEKNDKSKKLESFKKIKKGFDNLSKKMEAKSTETNTIKLTFTKLSNDKKSLESTNYTPEDLISKNDIIDLYQLKDRVISEIKKIGKKKEDFKNNFNNKNLKLFKYPLQNSLDKFTYPDDLQNSLDNILTNTLNSFHNFEETLNSCNKEIKEEITNILNKAIKPISKGNKKDLPESPLYNQLNSRINEEIQRLNFEQNNANQKRNQQVINAFHKEQINLELNQLRNSINQINDFLIWLDRNTQNCQSLIDTLNQDENKIRNKFCFLANEVKKKNQILESIKKDKDNLNMKKNTFNSKSGKLKNTINNFYMLEQEFTNYNGYEYSFDDANQEISNFKVEIKNLMNEINIFDRSDNFINRGIVSNFYNLDDVEFLIQDSFYNLEDVSDPIYNSFIEKEKQMLITIFKNKRKSFENEIIKNKVYYIQKITLSIINGIIINEQSKIFFKNKIIKEIDSIAKDDNKYKINHLTILIVGRNGIGKTVLIKYILNSNNIKIKMINEDFTEYTSDDMKYLKLIEVKGIGYDDDSTIKATKEKIKNYIDNLINDNNQNYNDIIHCIWYCISDNKFIESEKTLFYDLKQIYKDNIMPIIFVYTQAFDLDLASQMENYLREQGIDNSFTTVMAKQKNLTNGIKLKAFGKENLIKTTLEKCTEALGSNMLKIMIRLISNNIKENIIQENKKIKEQIISKTRNDFLEKYKIILGDQDFIEYIINIFFNYLNEFFNEKQTITNKSQNLVTLSSFISSIKNQYFSYKEWIKEIIAPIVKTKSEEFVDLQASFEKENGNMKYKNRRNYKDFEKTIEIFLKKNFYFMAQNFIINQIINPTDNYLNDFLSLLLEEFSKIINSLSNINDNNDPDCVIIRHNLESCFKLKLASFSKNNIIININRTQLLNVPYYKYFQLSPNDKFVDEKKVHPFKNSNSLIFHKNGIDYKNILQKIKINEINKNWFILKEYKWNFLSLNLAEKIKNFLEKIEYQDSSINLDNNDKVFNTLQTIIRIDLINFFNDNLSNYFKNIYSYFTEQKNSENNNNSIIINTKKIREQNEKSVKSDHFICSFDILESENNDCDQKKRYNNYPSFDEEINDFKEEKIINNNINNYYEDKSEFDELVVCNKDNNNYEDSGNKFIEKEIEEEIINNDINNYYEDNGIESIIKKENMEDYYKNIIKESLIEYSKQNGIKDLKHITIIIEGRSGAGKSTLINCFLKEELAQTGVGDIVTEETKIYGNKKIPFLKLIDTRGYELNEQFNPDKIVEEVLFFIENRRETKDYNNLINCLWFCVKDSKIDNREINALKQLKDNIYHIPLIVVFPNAQDQDKVDSMRSQIKSIFNDNIKFIDVLGKESNIIKEKYGLDKLLFETLDSIKSIGEGDLFDLLKNEYRQREEKMIETEISKIKENSFNKLVENFINGYLKVLNEKDFEQYIYDLFGEIIISFSFKGKINPETKDLIKNTKNLVNRIKSFIQFYSKEAEEYINMIIYDKSFEYLNIQVEIEKEKECSINPKNKKNREEFKKLISSFLKDNFYYVAQKFFVYVIIKDLIEDLCEKLEEKIFIQMKNYLLKNEFKDYYHKIYAKVIEEFEEGINKYKSPETGNIYD